MASEIFVDTSAWYPAAVSNHADHDRVAKALTARVQRRQRVVTTNLVIAETHALLLHRVHRKAALTFANIVRQSPNLVVYADAKLEQAALEWLARFKDQDFSFCDAVSFSVMASRKIGEALTLDRHFVAAGFGVVP